MLPRRFSLALACAGTVGGLLVAGLATLPATAASTPESTVRAPLADPSPSSGTEPTSSGIVVLPTTQAPPTSQAPPPTSAVVPTHSAARTSAAAPTSHAVSTLHASSSVVPTSSTRTSHAATTTTAASGGSTGGSSGGAVSTYYPPPAGLPTDVAASQGPVALVTSKAANGKPVLVQAAVSNPDRKVGKFSLSSVLVTTVVGAGIVAAIGGLGLWLTRRYGTRLSQADAGPTFPA